MLTCQALKEEKTDFSTLTLVEVFWSDGGLIRSDLRCSRDRSVGHHPNWYGFETFFEGQPTSFRTHCLEGDDNAEKTLKKDALAFLNGQLASELTNFFGLDSSF